MPWGAAITAGGAILGGLITSSGQQSAANTQANASKDATQAELDMYNQTRTDNAPALGARNDALTRLEQLLGIDGNGPGGIDPATVMADPGYQFGLNQGQAALTRASTAHGMRDSGASLMAASRYGTDYATTKYDAALNRQLNPLQSLAGLGQSGANANSAAGTAAGAQIGSNIIGAGNAQAAAQIGSANAWANTGNQLAGWYQNQQRATTQPTGWASGPQSSSWYDSDVYGPQ